MLVPMAVNEGYYQESPCISKDNNILEYTNEEMNFRYREVGSWMKALLSCQLK